MVMTTARRRVLPQCALAYSVRLMLPQGQRRHLRPRQNLCLSRRLDPHLPAVERLTSERDRRALVRLLSRHCQRSEQVRLSKAQRQSPRRRCLPGDKRNLSQPRPARSMRLGLLYRNPRKLRLTRQVQRAVKNQKSP
jgi:hypothetical protein